MMMSAKTYLKQQKTYLFHKEWEKNFLSCSIPDVCASSAMPASRFLRREHFITMHNKYTKDFSVQSELRKKS